MPFRSSKTQLTPRHKLAYYAQDEISMDLLVDKETVAIQSIVSSLEPLTADERRRVLTYANLRYEKSGSRQQDDGEQKSQPDDSAERTRTDHTDVASLFEEARPQSCPERALIAGYWFQVVQSQKDFESRDLTRVVADLGHPTKNITRDMRPLLGATPKLMSQVVQGGSGASRRYRLTTEGVRAVQKRIAAVRP
jgi:hypothetical protein